MSQRTIRRSIRADRVNSPLIFWLLFSFFTVMRCLQAVFPKIACTYVDELIYLEAAQNIWLHGSLTLYGLPLSFSKILYPVMLSPFYAIRDPSLRIQTISVFNGLLVSSSLIPAWLLSRRILKNRTHRLLALVLLAISPHLGFCMTFMAECLYIPLSLWCFYVLYRQFAQGFPSLKGAFFTGFLLFLAYLSKEAGVALLGAALALYGYCLSQNTTKRKSILVSALVMLVSFGGFLLIFRMLFFQGMGGSYAEQASPGNLSDSSHLLFLLVATLYMLLYYLFSLFFFPVILPLSGRKKLESSQLVLLRFSGAYTLLVAVGIAFAISLPDNFGTMGMRVHLRYFIPVFYPFLLLFIRQREDMDTCADKLAEPPFYKQSFCRFTCLIMVLFILFIQNPRFGSLVDAPWLYHLRWLMPKIPDLALWIKIGSAVVLLTGMILWIQRKRRILFSFILVGLVIMEVSSCILFTRQARREMAPPSEELTEEAGILDRYLDTLEGNILVIRRSVFSAENRLMDTWCDDDYFVIHSRILQNLMNEPEASGCLELDKGGLNWTNLVNGEFGVMTSYLNTETIPAVTRVDWIVNCDDQIRIDRTQNTDVTPKGLHFATVWRPKDPTKLNILESGAYDLGTPILFHGEDANAFYYPITGLSVQEAEFTWTEGHETTVTLKPTNDPDYDVEAALHLMMTLGDQHVTIYVNDAEIYDEVVSGETTLNFTIPVSLIEAGDGIMIRMDLPDATTPGNGDERVLGLALESLVLTERGE